ncbi:MAG TPA: hypothetical protein DCY13_02940 [Verrucomicrobiales bacterium]|nr:hypothetical protein [Verrucomicrobiales bacterium]
MSYEERKGSSGFLYILAVVGALLIMKYTVNKVSQHTAPEPLGAERNAERIKAREEVEAAAQAVINSYGWVDKDRQIAHVPVDRGIELMLAEWQSPKAGRAKLISLSAKATAELPQAPAEPNPFE